MSTGNIRRRHLLIALGAIGATAALGAAEAAAQGMVASRPVRLIVPFAPGGTTDVFARVFATHFSKALGETVVVENKGGAGGLLGAGEVSRAQPDGYTLVFQSPTSGITGPLTKKTPPFDPVAGFSHIAILGISPIVLAVSPTIGVTSLRELVALARSRPEGLTYATGGTGGAPHLSAELFRLKAGGFKAVHVPYRGAGPVIPDLISGIVAYMPDTFTTLLPLHKEGRVKIISVFGEERAAVAPEIPTAKEEGFDVVTRIANYISAPPHTPRARLDQLAAAARTAMAQEEVVERLKSLATVPVTDSDPDRATRFITEEVALWKPVIETAGINLD
ncbi:tripartite tricarboxylate transporter substrate binding protein [Xanthobacter sp. KR7-225]|uniref:Bug family tripartite tricarboxylate transporter substrate binding protein n=1 Tax=Xanthobacter sp. KR7-225 TaxID=3156613 RepID=UPI0032B33059